VAAPSRLGQEGVAQPVASRTVNFKGEHRRLFEVEFVRIPDEKCVRRAERIGFESTKP
jgi:hypothetical protein